MASEANKALLLLENKEKVVKSAIKISIKKAGTIPKRFGSARSTSAATAVQEIKLSIKAIAS